MRNRKKATIQESAICVEAADRGPRGAVLVKEYIDDGITGTLLDRPRA